MLASSQSPSALAVVQKKQYTNDGVKRNATFTKLPYWLLAAYIIKQIMAKIPLTNDSEFVVGEEKVINYAMAVFFLALFLYGLIDAINRHFRNIDYQSYIFALALVPVIYCLRRAHSKRVYIRINKTGIYHHEQLVTGWPNFLKAFIAQKEKKSFFNILDNFLLIVEYRKDGHKDGFRSKIPLTNTQNKSEEEVLEAVKFFWKEYRHDANC